MHSAKGPFDAEAALATTDRQIRELHGGWDMNMSKYGWKSPLKERMCFENTRGATSLRHSNAPPNARWLRMRGVPGSPARV